MTLAILASCGRDDSPTAPDLARAPGGGGSVTSTVISPSGEETTVAAGINDAGQVVGYMGTVNFEPRRAYLWTPVSRGSAQGTMRELGTMGGQESDAKDVNNSGHVVGVTNDAAGVFRPFYWTVGGGFQDLGGLDGPAGGVAWDVDDAGHVVGELWTGAGLRAAIWTVAVDAAGIAQVIARDTIGSLPGEVSSRAMAVNRKGQAVGWTNPSGRPVLFTTINGAWHVEDLGTLAGDVSGAALGINDQGQVVGYSRSGTGCAHAVLWTTAAGRVTGVRALPTLGGSCATAEAINEQGIAVGGSTTSTSRHGVMWTLGPDGSVLGTRDLGKVKGTTSSGASSVSALVGGMVQAAGSGTNATHTSAIVWTVKP